MNRSIQDLSQLREWRKQKNIEIERDPLPKPSESQKTSDEYHFLSYDPIQNPDLANIHISKKKKTNEKAILSIPLDFTKETKTNYKRHDKTEFGFDVRIFLTKNNAPFFPIRK